MFETRSEAPTVVGSLGEIQALLDVKESLFFVSEEFRT